MSESKFIYLNQSLPFNHYMIIAESADRSAHIQFDTLRFATCVTIFVNGDWLHVDLTKDQITHFLSIDCPDAFIAYALTLIDIPASDKTDFSLTAEEISTVICGLQWSINHHKSLSDDAFCDAYDERREILDRHYRLKSMFQTALENL